MSTHGGHYVPECPGPRSLVIYEYIYIYIYILDSHMAPHGASEVAQSKDQNSAVKSKTEQVLSICFELHCLFELTVNLNVGSGK